MQQSPEALYLSRIAQKVYVIVRAPQMRAKDMRKVELEGLSNVEIMYGWQTKSINGTETVTGITLESTRENRVLNLDINGVFLAIGSDPNTQSFRNKLTLDHAGYIVVNRDQETNIPGIFAAGDIADPLYKQAATALGDSCRAALRCVSFLEHVGYIRAQKPEHTKSQPLASAGSVAQAPQTISQSEGSARNADSSPAISTARAIAATQAISDTTLAPAQATSTPELIEVRNAQQLTSLLMQQGKVSVVDFYATWCPPCKQMHPVIEQLAQDFAGTVRFIINVIE